VNRQIGVKKFQGTPEGQVRGQMTPLNFEIGVNNLIRRLCKTDVKIWVTGNY